MAKAGDRMVSAETGETFIFVKTAADTDGQLLVVDLEVAPGGGAKAAPMHIHPKQEERFYITQGTMQLTLNGVDSLHGPDSYLVIPAGMPHTWRNGGSDELRFRVELEPAGQMEKLFEALCIASKQGKLSADGKVSPVRMAVYLAAYPDNMLLAGIPVRLQKMMFVVLALFGRLMGLRTDQRYFNERLATGETARVTSA